LSRRKRSRVNRRRVHENLVGKPAMFTVSIDLRQFSSFVDFFLLLLNFRLRSSAFKFRLDRQAFVSSSRSPTILSSATLPLYLQFSDIFMRLSKLIETRVNMKLFIVKWLTSTI
jgi:hypothetical protein